MSLQNFQNLSHVLAHAKFFSPDFVALDQPGALQDFLPGLLQVFHANLGQPKLEGLLDVDMWTEKIAPGLRQLLQALGRQLDLFVFSEAACQFCAGVFGFLTVCRFSGGQQHA